MTIKTIGGPPLPAEVLAQHVAVLGKTRSGKSSVMRLLVEDLLDRHQPVCIVDPKGDWWGIKLDADGKRPGYSVVIFGGEHADVPINEHAGANVAEMFATGNRPCLIDLGGWMPGARTRFWIDFASTLFKHTKGQRWLAVDEIHNFAPKAKALDVDAGKMLHWTNRLASEGLGKGLAMVFASQRPQKVHNDTLTSAETLIAMRVLHPSDRGAVSDWIKGCGDSGGGEVLNSLAQMDRGEGWVWSPEIRFGPQRLKFPMFSTYDSFRPQTVDDTKKLKGWAEVNLDEVREQFAAISQQVRANDPRELQKRVKELEAQLKRMKTEPTEVPTLLLAARVHEETERRVSAIASEVDRRLERIRTAAIDLTTMVTQLIEGPVRNAVSTAKAMPLSEKPFVKKHDAPRTFLLNEQHETHVSKRAPRSVAARTETTTSGNGDITPQAQKFLNVAATFDKPLTSTQLAIMAGYSPNSGGTAGALAALRREQLLVGNGRALELTDAGRARATSEDLPRGRALLDYWTRHQALTPQAGEFLRLVYEAHPKTITAADVAEKCGYSAKSGGTAGALALLRKLELIEGKGDALKISGVFLE